MRIDFFLSFLCVFSPKRVRMRERKKRYPFAHNIRIYVNRYENIINAKMYFSDTSRKEKGRNDYDYVMMM